MYLFCRGCINADDLMINLKKNIIECQNSGLTVVASVCDQEQTNVSAINRLVRERRGEDIYP
jgi:hypothetical protein